MLSQKDFVARWGPDQFECFAADAVDQLPLSAEEKAFLTQAGLQTSASPFVSFDAPTSGELPTLADQYGLSAEFRRYRLIGSDGAGNPIALDEQSHGVVVCLDHERGFASTLMNTSIRQMAESLLAYRKLIEDTQAEFGPDAYLDGKVSLAARMNLREELTKIDPAAVKPGTFWFGEFQNLDANAG